MQATITSKLEQCLNETYKILRHRIAAKFRMHLIGSLIKLNRISEVLMHTRFFEKLIKSWKNSLVTYNKTGTSQVGATSKAQKCSRNNYRKHLEKIIFF